MEKHNAEYSYPMQLTEEQGQVLVRLARQTLLARLGRKPDPGAARTLETELAADCFQQSRGTFVCLKMEGRLRGCIGSLIGEGPIAEGVKRNAVLAAFQDTRFPPLAAEELALVKIEVSVLTEPQTLAYAEAADLIAKLRPFKDGVIIRRGLASATFLPQVWEQLPQPESFLAHLCQKAGLPADSWRSGRLEIMTYQVQYFNE